MKRQKRPSYKITAWSPLPCPYDEFSWVNPAVTCDTYCGENRENAPCIEKITRTVKFWTLERLLEIWYSLWYDYITVDIVPGKGESTDGR